jgi:hypothetical protein
MSHRQKLDWARHHLDLLDRAIEEYQLTCPFREHAEYSPMPPFVVGGPVHVDFRFEIVNPIPSHIPLLIGDCLTNFRASLDHLIFQLATQYSPSFTDKVRIQFPIATDPSTFAHQISGPLKHLSPEVLAAITHFQPFKAVIDGCPPNAHPLKLLNDLVNVDKHRAVLIIPAPSYSRAIFSVDPPTTEPYGEAIRSVPYRTGDIIGTVEFVARDPVTEFSLAPNEIDFAVYNPETQYTASARYVLNGMHEYIEHRVFSVLEPMLERA